MTENPNAAQLNINIVTAQDPTGNGFVWLLFANGVLLAKSVDHYFSSELARQGFDAWLALMGSLSASQSRIVRVAPSLVT